MIIIIVIAVVVYATKSAIVCVALRLMYFTLSFIYLCTHFDLTPKIVFDQMIQTNKQTTRMIHRII